MADQLPFVKAPLGYLAEGQDIVRYRVWPPSSGRQPESPAKAYQATRIQDCRGMAGGFDLDRSGLDFREHTTRFSSFLDEARVKASFYPEMEDFLRALTGAAAVFVFDHNVRSASGAANGQVGVRAPVDIVHGDYTASSGPRRSQEVLESRCYDGKTPRRMVLVNVWRPLHGPILDLPLAICCGSSVASDDLVPTPIEHFSEGNLTTPSHTGEILSVRHNPAHQWFYASEMQPWEVLVFKGYDSDERATASYTPHTGFAHPDCPERFVPRQSIEVRALLVDPTFASSASG